MSAFGAAISGLQSSQQWLNVISDNVANSETVGYKAGVVNFATLISQTLQSPSPDNQGQNIGGIDAIQVGLGVTVGSIATDLRQGSITTTGTVTDIAIEGQGYLTVNTGSTTQYTRAGNLTFDSNGDLVTANGGLVQGWSLKESINPTAPDAAVPPAPPVMTIIGTTLNTTNTSAIGNIVIPNNLQIAPKQTSNNPITANQDLGVALAGNLDSSTPNTNFGLLVAAGYTGAAAPTAPQAQAIVQDANATSNFTIFDSLGTPMNITIYWFQTAATPAAPASWSYVAFNTTNGVAPNAASGPDAGGGFLWSGGDGGGVVGITALNAGGVLSGMTGPVTFNNDGSLATNGNVVNPALNPGITMPEIDGSMNPELFSIDLGTPNNPLAVPPTWGNSIGMTGAFGGGVTNPTTGIYTPKQSIYTKHVDGYEKGTLTGLSFNTTGGVEATFTNGQTIVIAQLALTNFTNPGGLENNGGNYFTQSDNSGSAQIGTAGSNGFGLIDGGALEQSNVSMSTELTNMILAQTMYQSSAKVISTQSTLFTALFNAIPG